MSCDPSCRAISTQSRRCASAFCRTSASGLQIDPYLYSCDWKRLGLMDPARIRYFFSSARIRGTLATPSGRSHSTCNPMVGLAPVRRLICAASANLSSIEVAAATCRNLPKRVPVLANPQEGISMRKLSSAFATRSTLSCGFMRFNLASTERTESLLKYRTSGAYQIRGRKELSSLSRIRHPALYENEA